jgi:hypothetical protein
VAVDPKVTWEDVDIAGYAIENLVSLPGSIGSKKA